MPIAAIAFDFDPLFRLADALVVRWQTIALAIVIAAALIAAGVMARRVALRPDDLLFIAVGVVPGAVIGGRLGHVLLHLDYYGGDPGAILDPSSGGLELGLAVVGGLLTASSVAKLLGAPFGAWAQVAILPVLFTLGAGKLTMVLGGAGQGRPSDAPWATAFIGPGPWSSLAPPLPSHPSQAYEGIATLAILLVMALILAGRGGAPRRTDGRLLFIGLAGWALVRAAAAMTWRDSTVIGPFDAGAVIALGIAVGCFAAASALAFGGRGDATVVAGPTDGPERAGPDRSDPAEPPRI